MPALLAAWRVVCRILPLIRRLNRNICPGQHPLPLVLPMPTSCQTHYALCCTGRLAINTIRSPCCSSLTSVSRPSIGK